MEKTSYHNIKRTKIGQAEVEVYCPNNITEEIIKNQLLRIYDTINNIASLATARGVDVSKWFYSDNAVKKLKLDPNNKFI